MFKIRCNNDIICVMCLSIKIGLWGFIAHTFQWNVNGAFPTPKKRDAIYFWVGADGNQVVVLSLILITLYGVLCIRFE